MTLLSPSAERLAASDAAIASLPNFANHEPGANEFAVLDPSTEQRIATLPSYSTDYAIEQVAIADEAGRAWAATTPRHRSDVLHNVYAHLIANRERLAFVISREMGKTLAEATGEVQYAADYVRWNADSLLSPAGGYRENPVGGSTILTKRAPVGLALLIAPWNFPMAMITRKIAPAIAAGCGSVIKPAGLTPLTTLLTVELMAEAGVPRELMRVVTTTQSGAFSEAVLGLLSPETRTLGPMLPSQMRGAIMGAPLPFDQSVLLIWPQVTGLIAGMIVVFAAAYVIFQREEVRA